MYVNMYIHIYIHAYIHTHTYIQTYIQTYTHTHTYIHTHICIHTHTHTHTYIHTYIHTCMHAYIHTYIHTYIHVYPTHISTCLFYRVCGRLFGYIWLNARGWTLALNLLLLVLSIKSLCCLHKVGTTFKFLCWINVFSISVCIQENTHRNLFYIFIQQWNLLYF
jgi:hypothetical protein